MRPHDRPGGAWGRHNEVRDGANAEEHEAVVGAMLLGEFAQRDVIAAQVLVAYHRKAWRGRRETRLLLATTCCGEAQQQY